MRQARTTVMVTVKVKVRRRPSQRRSHLHPHRVQAHVRSQNRNGRFERHAPHSIQEALIQGTTRLVLARLSQGSPN